MAGLFRVTCVIEVVQREKSRNKNEHDNAEINEVA
jgi:hypothetical protein